MEFRRARSHGVLTCLLVLVWLVGAVGEVPAQVAQPADEAAATVPSESPVTTDALQVAIDELEADTALPQEVRDKALSAYKDALNAAKTAQTYAQKATQFKEAASKAPAMLESLKAKLATPLPEPEPSVPEGATLGQLEQLAAQAQAELDAARKTSADLQTESQFRLQRRDEIPKRIVEVRQALDELNAEIAAAPAPDLPPELARAQQSLLLARRNVLERELEALNAELASYDSRRDLLMARRDEAARQASRAEKLVSAWQTIVENRRTREAQQAALKARMEAARALPAIRAIAERNAELAEQRTGPEAPATKIKEISPGPQEVQKRAAELREELQTVRDRVKAAGGLNKAIGLSLLSRRENLPDLREHRRRIQQAEADMARAALALVDLREERFRDVEPLVQDILDSLPASYSREQRDDVEAQARELLAARREYLDGLMNDYSAYMDRLSQLAAAERALVSVAEEYADYVDERILWVQSTAPLHVSTFKSAVQAAGWLVGPSGWQAVAGTAWRDLQRNPGLVGLALVVVVVLFLQRGRMLRALAALSQPVERLQEDQFRRTFQALLLSVALALRWPLVLLLVSWRLSASVDAAPFVGAVAAGLRVAAFICFWLEIMRIVCLDQGLGDGHFRFREEARRSFRRHLRWFAVVALPAAFVFGLFRWQPNEVWAQSAGRLVFMMGMGALCIFMLLVLRPSGPIVRGFLARHSGGWLDKLRYLWHWLAVALPASLIVIAGLGYYYTAIELEQRLQATIVLVLLVMLADALTVRWLQVARRNLAVRKALEARAAAEDESKGSEQAPVPETAGGQAPERSIYSLSRQTVHLVNAVLVISVLVGLWAIWADVLPALGKLEDVELWSTTGRTTARITDAEGVTTVQAADVLVPITLASVTTALLAVLATVVAARNLPGLLEMAVLQHLPMDRGIRFAITTLSQYVIVLIGLVIAFTSIGIGWSKVQWLIAAMTVGLGFGLQEIFANFVSGLIILFERPMRVGDTVTVGDTTGTVSRIRIRATTILDWNRRELVVPNKEFITGRLVNWTLTDTVLRMEFPVGIAYGSDTELAEKTLRQVAAEHPTVLEEPAPVVIFKGFSDSCLSFELRLFIPNMESYVTVWHQVNRAIDDAFRKARIEIAFPQRDVHVRSVDVPFRLQDKADADGEDPEPAKG